MQAAGIVVATQAGTRAEALAAEQAGVDLLVARGGEGGGHGRDDVATLPLLQVVLDAVSPVSGRRHRQARGLAAVLAAGAAGAWVGTAFLACTEAATSAGARELLLAAADTDTAYGRVFDVGSASLATAVRRPRPAQRVLRPLGRPEDELAADDVAAAELRAAREPRRLRRRLRLRRSGRSSAARREAARLLGELAGAEALLDRAAGRSRTDARAGVRQHGMS